MKTLTDNEPHPGRAKHLASLVREFVARYPKFQTQAGSYNKCKFASYELVLFLRRRGFNARLLHIQNCPAPNFPDAHPTWAAKRRDKWSHYTVAIGRWSVDVTARQFDTTLKVPHVVRIQDLRLVWKTVEYDRFLNRWITETLAHKDTI
jgi:hypothetical protein